VRGRLTALNAKTGEIMWRWFTLPGPEDIGGETWPAGTDHAMRGGAAIWNTPALDPELGLIYFAVGNCGPDYDGSMREGDNLFCTSIVALKAKTGEYAWHFQQVHHDIWDYDAASPVVLFDTVINGRAAQGDRAAGRTGWVYILDRTNGKPLDRHRGEAGAAGPAAEDGQDAAVSRLATRPCLNARSCCRAMTRPAASSRHSGKLPC
jgi:alcohol dehydrogenase (cytochrome c)